MKVTTYLAVCAMTLAATSAVAGSKKKHAMSAEMQKHMEMAMKRGSPGPHHAILKDLEGDWKVMSYSWMTPQDKPTSSKGTSKIQWVFGGRYLQQEFSTNWQGHPFQGQGFLGYDNVREKFVSIWMDNMSTGIMNSMGTYDAATKTLTETGVYSCSMTGNPNKWFRSQWKLMGPNKNMFSMWSKDQHGTEFKSMELVYTRSEKKLTSK